MSDQQATIDRLRQLLRETRKLAETDLFSKQLEILTEEMDGLEAKLDPKEVQQLLDEMA